MGGLNGLSLFSGIGGLELGLKEWVRTVAYCERDTYARGVLLSHMAAERLPIGPVFPDVTKLRGDDFPPGSVDIIFGGFPCQDISVAGHGRGLEGKRSGLYFEVERLVREITPTFVFLENVPAIRTRGGERVVKGLAGLGYDCRWTTLSAAEVGANHKRERWFLLAANTKRIGIYQQCGRSSGASREGSLQLVRDGEDGVVANTKSIGRSERRAESAGQEGRLSLTSSGAAVADPRSQRLEGHGELACGAGSELACGAGSELARSCSPSWWSVEPNVGRVANGIPHRVDRIRCLGNAVVPLQARTAFCRLMGLEKEAA